MDKLDVKQDKLHDTVKQSIQRWLESADIPQASSSRYKKMYRTHKTNINTIQKKIRDHASKHDALLEKVALIEDQLHIRSSEPY